MDMKDTIKFFNATQKEINRLERYRNPSNRFTFKEYRKTAAMFCAAKETPKDCPEKLKKDIEKASNKLIELTGEIVDLQFYEVHAKFEEATVIMETLDAYVQHNLHDGAYIKDLLNQSAQKLSEAMQIELAKQNFKHELVKIAAEVSAMSLERQSKSNSIKNLLVVEDEILESSLTLRP